ncbi:MAG: YkgJ family cysteine cluster protein [Desulfobulbaceae bacterium]|jgi:Fe-S-cluster containining protein|nr:YkgJ family cysteine cluster protein [Desulfobulbaceae bacterium]
MTTGPDMNGIMPLAAGETFRFACHRGRPCFTECCRMLELALHPYDFVLLRRATGLDSPKLFERFIIEEDDRRYPFPRHYLAMVDDGRASCPFVDAKGCQIYPFRPAACRSYPVGRAALFHGQAVEERFVLVREEHCRGFADGALYRPADYLAEQGLTAINRCHDAVARLLQRPEMRTFTASDEEKRLYVLALCQTDLFRARLQDGDFADFTAAGPVPASDEELLPRAAAWLGRKFFPSS